MSGTNIMFMKILFALKAVPLNSCVGAVIL